VKDRFEDILKQKFDGFEVTPPPEVFQKISANKLMQPQTVLNRIHRQIWVVSAIIITVAIMSVIYFNSNQSVSNTQSSTPIAEDPILQKPTTHIAKQPSNQETTKQKPPVLTETKTNISKPVQIETKKYIFVGKDTVICSNQIVLIARTNLKSFLGQWVCSDKNVKLLSPKSPKTIVRFSKKGTYQFIYSGFYNQTFMADTISVMVMGLPPANRFMDTSVCGLTVELPKSNNVKWSVFKGNGQITTTNQTYNVISKESQSVQLIREATSGTCVFTDTVLFRFNEPTDFSDFSFHIENALCYQKGKITTNFHGNYVCLFDGEIVKNPKVIYAEPGNHLLTIQDKNNCKKDFPVVISRTGKILPDFSTFSLTNNANMPVYFRNQTTIDAIDYDEFDNVKFFWDFGDNKTSNEANPEHTFKKPGTYNVILTVSNNDVCQEKIRKQIIIKPNSDIKYPNVFSPNGDGKNDIFFISATDLVEFKGEIFSSSTGEKVFEWSDPAQGWNGKINGNDDAPEGIYYFVLKGKGKDGKLFVKKSNLYLKR